MLVALFAPILVGISAVGNVQPLLIAALVWSVERRSGPAWIGVAASLKIFPILFAAVYLGRREWARAASPPPSPSRSGRRRFLYDLRGYATDAGQAASLFARARALAARRGGGPARHAPTCPRSLRLAGGGGRCRGRASPPVRLRRHLPDGGGRAGRAPGRPDDDRRRALPIRRALIGAALVLAVAANLVGLATIVIDHQRAFDWDNYVEAARRFPLGTLYDWQEPYYYRYAPQLAPGLRAAPGARPGRRGGPPTSWRSRRCRRGGSRCSCSSRTRSGST